MKTILSSSWFVTQDRDGSSFDQAAILKDVLYAYIGCVNKQVAGNQVVAVAHGGAGLAAQDRRGVLICQLEQLLDAKAKPGSLHHLGVIDLMQVIGAFSWQGVMDIAAWVAWSAT
jgi:hypothetical protein